MPLPAVRGQAVVINISDGFGRRQHHAFSRKCQTKWYLGTGPSMLKLGFFLADPKHFLRRWAGTGQWARRRVNERRGTCAATRECAGFDGTQFIIKNWMATIYPA